MRALSPQEFIQATFINDLGRMIESKNFYLSFIIMGIGIEFLGKCLSPNDDWQEGKPGTTFKKAVNTLDALKEYRRLLTEYDLYSSLRCGLAHAALPKYQITLSSTHAEAPHLLETNDSINLHCESFFKDFKKACEEVIAMQFSAGDKMNNPIILVPGETINEQVFPVVSGQTSVTMSYNNEANYKKP
jgi:hypothetical protein